MPKKKKQSFATKFPLESFSDVLCLAFFLLLNTIKLLTKISNRGSQIVLHEWIKPIFRSMKPLAWQEFESLSISAVEAKLQEIC